MSDGPLIADAMLGLAPPWLADESPASPANPSGGVGGRYVWLLGLMSDALVDKMQQGIYARLPLGGTSAPSGGNGGPYDDALGLLSADRLIVRGLSESASAFGARLQRAFTTWQHAGEAITVMQEVLAYLQTTCRCAIVSNANAAEVAHVTEFAAGQDTTLPPARWTEFIWNWDTGYGPGGVPGGVNGYDPHPLTIATAWWRTWLVLWPSTVSPAWTTDAGNIGAAGRTFGDSKTSIGLSASSSVVSSMRSIVATWKSASAWYRWIVVSTTADFINWSSGSAYTPATGDWQHWSKVATAVNPDGLTVPAYVPARDNRLRFCDGTV